MHALALLVAAAALTGCGTNAVDRALSGSGIGAGSGAVGAAIVGGPVAGAALLGAAAGAAIGGLSDSSTIDLGRPFWRQ